MLQVPVGRSHGEDTKIIDEMEIERLGKDDAMSASES